MENQEPLSPSSSTALFGGVAVSFEIQAKGRNIGWYPTEELVDVTEEFATDALAKLRVEHPGVQYRLVRIERTICNGDSDEDDREEIAAGDYRYYQPTPMDPAERERLESGRDITGCDI